jgi:hypothetical protein
MCILVPCSNYIGTRIICCLNLNKGCVHTHISNYTDPQPSNKICSTSTFLQNTFQTILIHDHQTKICSTSYRKEEKEQPPISTMTNTKRIKIKHGTKSAWPRSDTSNHNPNLLSRLCLPSSFPPPRSSVVGTACHRNSQCG